MSSICAFWKGHVGAAAGRCRVPLQGAASGCSCWSGVCALELGCRCRWTVLLQGAAAGRCCQSAVRALELACWCRWCCYRVLLSECGVRYEAWVVVSLQGWLRAVYDSVGVGPDGDYVYAVAKDASAWLPPKHIAFAIWGLCWRDFFYFVEALPFSYCSHFGVETWQDKIQGGDHIDDTGRDFVTPFFCPSQRCR